MTVFAKRLKDARLSAGLSQAKLGVLSGLDPGSASSRVNQYEKGKMSPKFDQVRKFAETLDKPVEYFYAWGDDVAELLVTYHGLDNRRKLLALKAIKAMQSER